MKYVPNIPKLIFQAHRSRLRPKRGGCAHPHSPFSASHQPPRRPAAASPRRAAAQSSRRTPKRAEIAAPRRPDHRQPPAATSTHRCYPPRRLAPPCRTQSDQQLLACPPHGARYQPTWHRRRRTSEQARLAPGRRADRCLPRAATLKSRRHLLLGESAQQPPAAETGRAPAPPPPRPPPILRRHADQQPPRPPPPGAPRPHSKWPAADNMPTSRPWVVVLTPQQPPAAKTGRACAPSRPRPPPAPQRHVDQPPPTPPAPSAPRSRSKLPAAGNTVSAGAESHTTLQSSRGRPRRFGIALPRSFDHHEPRAATPISRRHTSRRPAPPVRTHNGQQLPTRPPRAPGTSPHRTGAAGRRNGQGLRPAAALTAASRQRPAVMKSQGRQSARAADRRSMASPRLAS